MRNVLVLVALVCLGLSGCFTMHGDPSAPAAEGEVRLAAGAQSTGFTALEIHWDRVDGTYGESSVDVYQLPQAFPMQLYTGLGLGRSDAHTYRLSAWFSNGTWDQPTTSPPAGAAHATLDIAIPNCTDGCPAVRDVELVLAP
jgi:hypothetical protein